MHPHHEHRQSKVEKNRVGHILKGYKHGGKVHSDEKEDRKLFGKMIKEHDREAEGKKAKHRSDRVHRAKGGRVGKKGGATHVNVIVHGGGEKPPMPVPVPPPALAGPPPMPGGPPGGPMGGPPGAPPMPMRADGGVVTTPKKDQENAARQTRELLEQRGIVTPSKACGGPIEAPKKAYKKGGAVKSGPAWEEGVKSGTQVSHSPALSVVEKNMNRGKVVTFRTGGKVEAPMGVEKVSKLPGGGGGGEARLSKIKKYGFGKPMKGANAAR